MTIHDEMYEKNGVITPLYQNYQKWLAKQDPDLLNKKHREAQLLFARLGITFAVYGDGMGNERSIPFDVIPRLLSQSSWNTVALGCIQRIRALNLFLKDIYHQQEIIQAGIIPAEQIINNSQFRPEMKHIYVAHDIYAHIAGIDIVKVNDNEFYVLEDNLRTPSGSSYMIENRRMMMRLFPELFSKLNIAPVDHYPEILVEGLRAVSPQQVKQPTVVLLTPGSYNSAYFEHAFLAQEMGIELVEGADLFVKNDQVFMKTTEGPQQVDVIYRRIDDDFIDPEAFRADSMLGVPGLLRAIRAGSVTLANAIGTGVADDKSTYVFVPEMIRFYLGEKPILNNVPTFRLTIADDFMYVLANLENLVVKEVQGSGGYGMLIGPQASRDEIDTFRKKIMAHPEKYIAQPTLSLSTCPTLVEKGIAPRHVDLRPYIVSGREVKITPGGLTRVALNEGSLIVNSSQGGGTKDTWIVGE
ncbi:MAG: hypothetical protein B7Z65_03765 [Ferrovum sp. 21-44-67]|nr:MAG: hypothetical protein B7Z65_03765 [Ferrovum sp. 21-44-67]HQU05705.1 circularly permuted type 2 ATP-grasp protein [Ferrovaceae bacterium]